MGLMKSNKRVVQRRANAGWKGGAKTDPNTEKKVETARALAEQIAAKLGQQSALLEKDATQLTAEAIMRGTEAQPVTLSVDFVLLKKIIQIFHREFRWPSKRQWS
jgi:hypothetical protein